LATSKITEIGSLVPAFAEEQLIILFGPQATAELKDICVLHEFEKEPANVLEVGKKLRIGNYEYTITKVGDAANKNFEELGHVSIYFRTGENEILPGAIIAEPEIFPELAIGQSIQVL